MKRSCTLTFILLGMLSLLNGQSITVELSGADTVRQGERLQLTVSFENLSPDTYSLPELVGLQVVGGPSRRTQMSMVNGVTTSAASFVYLVEAIQPGLALVPSITVEEKEESYSTGEVLVFITADPNYIPPTDREEQVDERREPQRKRRPTVRM